MTARTTPALVKSAVQAAQAAGIEIGAIEVAPGGVVRVLAIHAVPSLPSTPGGNTCDDLFPGADETR